MRFDLLRTAYGGEAQRAVETASRYVQGAAESSRIGTQITVRPGSADVECGDRNDRSTALWKKNPAIAGERAETRLSAGAIVEPGSGREKRQAHVADAERIVGPLEEKLDSRPLDLRPRDE